MAPGCVATCLDCSSLSLTGKQPSMSKSQVRPAHCGLPGGPACPAGPVLPSSQHLPHCPAKSVKAGANVSLVSALVHGREQMLSKRVGSLIGNVTEGDPGDTAEDADCSLTLALERREGKRTRQRGDVKWQVCGSHLSEEATSEQRGEGRSQGSQGGTNILG